MFRAAYQNKQRGFRVRMNNKADYPQILEVIQEVSLLKVERKKKPSATASPQMPLQSALGSPVVSKSFGVLGR
jgi:hypothetical protein